MKFGSRPAALALCAALLSQSLSGCAMLPKEEELPAPPVYKSDAIKYDQVQVLRGDLQEWDTFTCKYQAAVEEKVSFQLADMEIEQVYVALGEVVAPGQLLAKLNTEAIDEQLDAQQEKVGSLQLKIEQLGETRRLQREKEALELERIATRIAEGTANQSEYDAKLRSNQANETAYESEWAYYSSLIAIENERLATMQAEREKHCIYAGIGGTVRSIGSLDRLSSLTSPFVIISDYSTNRFVMTVKERDLYQVEQVVTIHPENKDIAPLEAVITEITDLSSDTTVKLEITLQPVLPNTLLQNGDKGTVQLLRQESLDTLYLPEHVVQINPQFSLVYCTDDSGALITKIVEIGMVTDKKVEIKEGLKEGEFVVDNSKG